MYMYLQCICGDKLLQVIFFLQSFSPVTCNMQLTNAEIEQLVICLHACWFAIGCMQHTQSNCHLHVIVCEKLCALNCLCMACCSVCTCIAVLLNCFVGELAIEDLLKLYNLERCSATPDTDIEQPEEEEEDGAEGDEEGSVIEDREEGGTSTSSDMEMEEEEVEEEPGLELLVSGKSLKEVNEVLYTCTCTTVVTMYLYMCI